ncbi:lipoprotein 17-related variable surface protein, partial [Mycoplasmopsis agassizii]|uniref:lipoprotein 17-related variable surface protein n=1 Tax=Mycoplasmopsis agassizii TaxID=33922 RepID=UPI0009D7F46A
MWSTTDLELVTSGSNCTNGTLKVKVYLKQGDQFYTTTGDLVTDKASAGKEVTLSGFKNTSQELEAAAKTWYEALPATFAADSESAKKLASEFKSEEKIQALITAMTDATNKAKFTAPEGFTVSYSFVSAEDVTASGNTTTTLKFKALLKNGTNNFNSTDGKITTETAVGKEVSVTGFTSEETFALTAYKALTEEIRNTNLSLNGATGTEATTMQAKMASQVTSDEDYTTLSTALKPKVDSLNTSYADSGFKFEIIKVTPTTGQTNWDNTAGSLQVQLLLSSGEGDAVKYWKLDAGTGDDLTNATVTSQTTKDGATGRDANVTGFTTGQAYLSTQLASYTYKTVAATDATNLKKLSNVFKPLAAVTEGQEQPADTRLKDMVDTLNALKAESVTELDANAVVGYTLSATATDSKWSVAKEEDA